MPLFFGLVVLVAVSGQAPLSQSDPDQVPPEVEVILKGKYQPAPTGLQTPKELAEARLKLAREAFAVIKWAKKDGGDSGGNPYLWSLRLMEAELDVSGNKAGRIAAVQSHLDRVKEWEADTARLFRGGEVSVIAYMEIQWKRLEAESLLAKEKAEQ
jgi:hypothetical protein